MSDFRTNIMVQLVGTFRGTLQGGAPGDSVLFSSRATSLAFDRPNLPQRPVASGGQPRCSLQMLCTSVMQTSTLYAAHAAASQLFAMARGELGCLQAEVEAFHTTTSASVDGLLSHLMALMQLLPSNVGNEAEEPDAGEVYVSRDAFRDSAIGLLDAVHQLGARTTVGDSADLAGSYARLVKRCRSAFVKLYAFRECRTVVDGVLRSYMNDDPHVFDQECDLYLRCPAAMLELVTEQCAHCTGRTPYLVAPDLVALHQFAAADPTCLCCRAERLLARITAYDARPGDDSHGFLVEVGTGMPGSPFAADTLPLLLQPFLS